MSATLPTSTGQDAGPAPEGAAACSSASRSWLLIMAVLLVAHLPLLYRYFTAMWQGEEHYRFFPSRCWPPWDLPGSVVSASAPASIGCGMWRSPPTYCYWPRVCSARPLARRFSGRHCWWLGFCIVRDRFTGGTLTTIALLVLIVVHLPMDKDLELRTDLQFATARISSGLLNLAGISHLRLGTVIEFPGKKFFIEEACSGIRSLLTLVFVSVFYGVWLRRGLLHTVFLAASAVLWSAFANVVRMLTICVAYAYYGADLATGWPHELLGFVMLFLAMGLMLSTDQLVGFVLQPIPLFPMEARKHELPLNPFTEAWDRVVEFGSPRLGQIAELAPAVGDDRGTETAPVGARSFLSWSLIS